MFYAQLTRSDVLKFFPKAGRWCEVGVFRGAFSREIFQVVEPSELHLIDMWKWTYYDWHRPPVRELKNQEHFKEWMRTLVPDYNGGHPDKYLERFYRELRTWASEQLSGRIVLHRGSSVDMAARLPNNHFDVVYIDADHHYDAVLGDLFAYASKLRKGGILMCRLHRGRATD